jgi:hypothetical protein
MMIVPLQSAVIPVIGSVLPNPRTLSRNDYFVPGAVIRLCAASAQALWFAQPNDVWAQFRDSVE